MVRIAEQTMSDRPTKEPISKEGVPFKMVFPVLLISKNKKPTTNVSNAKTPAIFSLFIILLIFFSLNVLC